MLAMRMPTARIEEKVTIVKLRERVDMGGGGMFTEELAALPGLFLC